MLVFVLFLTNLVRLVLLLSFFTFILFLLYQSADICVPISESVLSPHISALDEHNKLSNKDHSWRKGGKGHAKHPLKGKI